MGLETDITDIQSLNQNWPPVSDPRAQGADHIRNIKKAIQLTFPNLKQCLLNDAQFTALGTLIGDGSGTFTVNGKMTVSDALTVPTVTDWTTQQAVGAKDAEGRYLKPGDADKRYLKPGDADGRYVASTLGLGDKENVQQLTFNTGSNKISAQTRDGVWHFIQPAGDYATNSALNTETTNRTNADTNLQTQINNRVQKTGDAVSWLQVTGNLWALGNNLSVYNSAANAWCNTYVDNSGAATWDLNGGTPGAPTGNKSWLRMYSDGTLRTGKDAVAFQSDLPSLPGKVLQVWHVDNVTSMSTINFPRAFSITPLAIWCQDMDGVNVDNATIRNRTNTGFQVQTGNNNTRNITFFALGDI